MPSYEHLVYQRRVNDIRIVQWDRNKYCLKVISCIKIAKLSSIGKINEAFNAQSAKRGYAQYVERPRC